MTGTNDGLAQSDTKRSIPAGILRQKQLGLSLVPVILRGYGWAVGHVRTVMTGMATSWAQSDMKR